MKSNEFILDGKSYVIERSKLRVWLQLEDIKSEIKKAVDNCIYDKLDYLIIEYISTAFSVEINWMELEWLMVAEVFQIISKINSISKEFPILRQNIEDKKIAWDYSGRTWYLWSHLLAKEYGWDLEYIGNFDPDDAIALLQEISISEQLQKEWEYGLSEIAYPYNSTTNTRKFEPLPRPDWMLFSSNIEVKILKIPKRFMPVGNVIRLDKNVEH